MRFFEQVVGVYFDDLDPFYILHNARYLLLFERTLGAFWMHIGFGAFQDSDQPDRFHLVRHNEVEYLQPVRGVGKVRIRLWVQHIGRTSLTFAFRMLPIDRDIDFARGRRTIVRVGETTLKPTPWTDDFRRIMQSWLGDGGSTAVGQDDEEASI